MKYIDHVEFDLPLFFLMFRFTLLNNKSIFSKEVSYDYLLEMLSYKDAGRIAMLTTVYYDWVNMINCSLIKNNDVKLKELRKLIHNYLNIKNPYSRNINILLIGHIGWKSSSQYLNEIKSFYNIPDTSNEIIILNKFLDYLICCLTDIIEILKEIIIYFESSIELLHDSDINRNLKNRKNIKKDNV